MKKYSELIKNYSECKIQLNQVLESLPNDTDRNFEMSIVDLIGINDRAEDDAFQLLKDIKLGETLSYKAFYLLCSLYRRRKDTTVYGELFGKYGRRFEDKDMYGYLKAMYLVQTGIPEKIKQAVALSSKSLEKVHDNIGVKHCYCEIVAEAFEEKIFSKKNEKELLELKKATEAIEEVINYSEEDYAKFHCTYGRILALNGDYKNARLEIKKAIDKEDSHRNDYSLRVSEYLKHLMAVSSSEQMAEVDKNLKDCTGKIEEFNIKIDGALSRNVEFLGFFATLVSFIIASVQFLSNHVLNEALKLIIVLGGVQMLVIGSFSIILSGKNGLRRSTLVFIMAIVTIFIGIKLM